MINRNRILNVGLQFLTLASRFIFIFFIAKYTDSSSLGFYGLFTATVSYSLYFVGLDFYVYLTREIIGATKADQGRMLKGHVVLTFILYSIFLPVAYFFLIKYSGWPIYLIFFYLPILFLEHFNQEMNRLLVALSEQVTATWIQFIRQGSWALAAVLLMSQSTYFRNLTSIMLLWVIAGIFAAIFAIYKVRRLQINLWSLPFDFGWIKKGVVVSFSFLIATLALRGIFTFDRYWMEDLAGIELVSVYVLCFGVANTLLAFLEAGAFSFAAPELVKAFQDFNITRFRQITLRLFSITLITSMLFGIASMYLLPYFLLLLDNSIYEYSIKIYPWVLSSVILLGISMVPHYALYGCGRDKAIIHSHISGFFTFIFIVWAAGGRFAEFAVLIALNLAFCVILSWKILAYWRIELPTNKGSEK